MSTLRGRPPRGFCLAGGISGSTIAHCSSVRSEGYFFRDWSPCTMCAHSSADEICANYRTNLLFCQAIFPDSLLQLCDQLDRLRHLFPVFADLGYSHQVPSERRGKDVFSAFLNLRPKGHFDGDVFLRVSSRCFQHQIAFAPTRLEGAFGQFRADHNAYASLLPEAERGVGQERNNGSTRKINSRFWSRNRPPLSVPRLRYPPAPPYQT